MRVQISIVEDGKHLYHLVLKFGHHEGSLNEIAEFGFRQDLVDEFGMLSSQFRKREGFQETLLQLLVDLLQLDDLLFTKHIKV